MTDHDDDRSPTLTELTTSIHALERAIWKLAENHRAAHDAIYQMTARTEEALAGIEAVAKDLWCYDPSPNACPALFSPEDIPF